MNITETKRIEKINGKLTKREVIRRMSEKARRGNGQFAPRHYYISYIARRIDKDIDKARQIIRWMADNGMINASINDKMVVFK